MPDTTSLPHPAVRLYGPRRGIGIALLALLLAFTALCLLSAALIARFLIEDVGKYTQLKKRGERINATISGRRAGEDESGATYYLTYRFEVENQVFEQETEVYEDEYRLYREGQTLGVVYLPDDPSTSMAEMVFILENRVTRVLLVVIPLGFLGTPSLLFFVWWWIFWRTAARLRKHGVTATATITDARRKGRHNPLTITFVFNATRPDGIAGPINGQDKLAIAALNFSPGDTINVRYLASKPEIFMIDVQSLIEAARE